MAKPPTGQLAQTCLMVRNLDKTLALYRDLLGMPVVRITRRDPPARSLAALGMHDSILEIFERRPDEIPLLDRMAEQRVGIHHLALWVENLEELGTRLTAAGYPFTSPIRHTPNWLGDALNVAWIEDPDGVKIELLEYCGPAEQQA
ncbi:MAG: VOC family protein [Chloroflexi bacterium]|nr:VOC family protein [Chloroflexota bacterium]